MMIVMMKVLLGKKSGGAHRMCEMDGTSRHEQSKLSVLLVAGWAHLCKNEFLS